MIPSYKKKLEGRILEQHTRTHSQRSPSKSVAVAAGVAADTSSQLDLEHNRPLTHPNIRISSRQLINHETHYWRTDAAAVHEHAAARQTRRSCS